MTVDAQQRAGTCCREIERGIIMKPQILVEPVERAQFFVFLFHLAGFSIQNFGEYAGCSKKDT